MKTEKKQTVQLAVLGVLVVGCVGYLSFSLIAPKQPAKHTDHKAAKAAKADDSEARSANDTSEPEAAVSPASQGWELYPDLASVPARRDPFIRQNLGSAEMAASVSQPPKSVPKLLPKINNSMARVPSIELKPINPFDKETPVVSAQPVTQEKPEPDEQITVTGVIRGESNVAIVRIGNSGRHVVREGQTIDGRYHVVSVTGDGAVLVYKNRHIPVKLGGVKNAK